MAHTVRDKSKLLSRVRRIQGQATALEKMLDGEAGCTNILQQIAAIRGAVNGLMSAVIEGHIRDHLVNEDDHERREHDFDEVLRVLNSYLK